MALRLVTAPTSEPITLADTKTFLKVDAAADNALIASLITAARQHLEGADGWLGRCFLPQTWELLLDAFPSCEPGRAIRLPFAPVSAITWIKYLDAAGALQTLATSVYRTQLDNVPPFIEEDYGQTWPSVYGVSNAVTVRFVAGYASAAVVPEPLKVGLKALVQQWYDGPATAGTVGDLASAYLAPYRVWAVA